MRIPQQDDFAKIRDWGLVENPCAAVDDFSEKKEEARWDNDRHCQARQEYIGNQSDDFINNRQQYYQSLQRPIDRTKWEYLKHRKAWFHPPIGWNQFSAPGISRIVDLGCGDGDQTQRVADHIAGNWMRAGYEGFPLEIVGIDLNKSRIANARSHTRSPHKMITMRFEQADILGEFEYENNYFDYSIMNGFLEIFDDDQVPEVLTEVSRLTTRGLYIRDVLDDYPGMYPRPNLNSILDEYGLSVRECYRVLKEPFAEEGTADPLSVWPMDLNQVLFAIFDEDIPAEKRY